MSPRTVRKPGRRAAGRRRGRGSTLLIGGIAIVFLAVASMIGYRAAETVPGRQYYNLKAEFTQADNLSNHYEVRIGGLRAGQILKPKVKDGKALVDIRLDKKFAPLKSDSKLQVRLRSAVGVRYLEITPGTKGHVLKDGDLLAVQNQTKNVALDQTLGILDPETRKKAQTFLDVLGEGANDNVADINLALKKLTPLLKDVQTLAKPIVAQQGITSRFVRNTAAGVGAFDGIRQTLAATFDPAERALRPISDSKDDISRTLDGTSALMDRFRDQLPPGFNRLAPALIATVNTARPALQQAPAALRETTRLMRGARPALRQAKATLNLAKTAVDPTINVLQTVQPQLGRINSPIDSARPLLKQLALHDCAIITAWQGWANWLKFGSPESNFIRFTIDFDGNNILSGSNAARPSLSRSINYPGPCVNGQSESGKPLPSPTESAKGLIYSKSFPVIR